MSNPVVGKKKGSLDKINPVKVFGMFGEKTRKFVMYPVGAAPNPEKNPETDIVYVIKYYTTNGKKGDIQKGEMFTTRSLIKAKLHEHETADGQTMVTVPGWLNSKHLTLNLHTLQELNGQVIDHDDDVRALLSAENLSTVSTIKEAHSVANNEQFLSAIASSTLMEAGQPCPYQSSGGIFLFKERPINFLENEDDDFIYLYHWRSANFSNLRLFDSRIQEYKAGNDLYMYVEAPFSCHTHPKWIYRHLHQSILLVIRFKGDKNALLKCSAYGNGVFSEVRVLEHCVGRVTDYQLLIPVDATPPYVMFTVDMYLKSAEQHMDVQNAFRLHSQ